MQHLNSLTFSSKAEPDQLRIVGIRNQFGLRFLGVNVLIALVEQRLAKLATQD